MKKIKIALLSAAAFCASNAVAEDLALKLNGRFNFEGASLKQSKLTNAEKYVTTNRKNLGTTSSAYVGVRVEAENDMMKYGAQVGLYTASRQSGSPSYERSHVFMESDYGKLELGSNYDVGQKMAITALTIARASGDNAENYAMMDIKDAAGNDIATQPMFPSFYLNKLDGNNREGTRKVTYYTPKIGPVQFGVSYIPDTANFGSLTLKNGTDPHNAMKTYQVGNLSYSQKKSVKDAISAGVTLEHEITDMTSIKLALTGECGKPAQNGELLNSTTGVTTKYKLAKLKTYNVGGIITTGNLSFVGSYSDEGKSLTSAEVFGTDRRTRYYSAGAVYAQGPVGISLSYYKANRHNNKTDTYVIGTDYTLAPGLQPYAEVALFNGKGKLPAVYKDSTQRKYKGAVFILGMNLSF